jgi:5-enolpyruvylshikimate-3-phosphate synthase
MFIKKTDGSISGENVELSLMGMDFISRFALVFSVLCSGENEIKNFSINNNSMNLVDILKNFGIQMTLDSEKHVLKIVGKGGCSNLSQPSNVLNVGNSINNLIFLSILASNQDFKTFITGGEGILGVDVSFLEKYLKNVDIIFNTKNRLPMLLLGKPNHHDKTSFVAINTMDKNFLLLLSLYSKYNAINIIDDDIKDEFVESIFKHYGMELSEKYSENTNFLTREVRKCKEIIVVKNSKLNIKAREFVVPVDIKEAFYTIFLFLFSDREEVCINTVAINEYNDSLLKILLDNGVNLQFKNQKILNGIKVSDISVKQSFLKPFLISKLRLRDAADYCIFIMLLNILKNNSFTMMGVDKVKKYDEITYEFAVNFCRQLGYSIEEGRGDLDFVSNKKPLLTNKINMGNPNSKTNIFLFFSTILLENNIESEINFELIKEEFPNVENVMNKLGFEING